MAEFDKTRSSYFLHLLGGIHEVEYGPETLVLGKTDVYRSIVVNAHIFLYWACITIFIFRVHFLTPTTK